MSTSRKGAFNSSHDENGLVDFEQILSDLCDLEHQLDEQSNLNDAKAVHEFSHPPSPPLSPRKPSNSTVIFKDYSHLKTNSPCKAKLGGGNVPNRSGQFGNAPNRSGQLPPTDVDSDLNCALMELSSLVGPGFDFDGYNNLHASADSEEEVCVSSDLRNSTRTNRFQSNRFQRISNGTNNNVHARSKSMENGSLPQRAISSSGTLQNNWQENLFDGGQNDSAFDDNVSLPSSGSRVSMATSSRSSGSSITNGVTGLPSESDESQRGRDLSKTALDKSSQSNLNKVFIRVYSPEGSSKNVGITEQMNVSQVIDSLLATNRLEPNLSWSLVEHLPGLWMERLLEDNERLTEIMLTWTKDSENRLLLTERPDKYDVFVYPEKYLTAMEDKNKKCDDTVRQVLIQEFLESNCRLPEFDGMLHIKLEGKKAWKKLYFILRASGIYYNPKGKSKSLIDLVCLQRLDLVEVYTGVGWKKKYKAPNDFGFALKHPQIQKKAPKYIKYFCAEDANSMWHWVNSIRLAKYGQQLHNNFVQQQSRVNQFFGGEDPISRSKQTALIQEKISKMFSQQVESASSFSSAAEISPSPMQTFRSESPDGSSSRLLMSCLEETGKTPANFGSPVHVTAEIARLSGGHARSSIKVVPPKSPRKPMTESISIHQLPPHPAVSNDDMDTLRESDFPLPPNHEMLSGSVDQLQNVGYPAFGRQANQKSSKMATGGTTGKWVTSQKHAVIKRTPSIGHREVEDAPIPYPPLGPASSPKPLPLPKPSFSPTMTAFSTSAGVQSPSSLPPVRRKFPSSSSFSDCDDGRISSTPRASPKPKPPLPPKRKDILKQSASVDSSPTRGLAVSSAGNLTLAKKPPVKNRPSSALSQQSLSPPPCSSPVALTVKRSPSCESWQNSNFLMDLERVILQKQANGAGFAKDVTTLSRKAYDDDLDDLPPPPAALLVGLKKSNRPPPPPKRSNETKLTLN